MRFQREQNKLRDKEDIEVRQAKRYHTYDYKDSDANSSHDGHDNDNDNDDGVMMTVQEWIDIAKTSLSQPERKKRKYTIALGSFEYTVDEDDLKAFLEEQAREKRGKVNY
jgi:hypothetical protein